MTRRLVSNFKKVFALIIFLTLVYLFICMGVPFHNSSHWIFFSDIALSAINWFTVKKSDFDERFVNKFWNPPHSILAEREANHRYCLIRLYMYRLIRLYLLHYLRGISFVMKSFSIRLLLRYIMDHDCWLAALTIRDDHVSPAVPSPCPGAV